MRKNSEQIIDKCFPVFRTLIRDNEIRNGTVEMRNVTFKFDPYEDRIDYPKREMSKEYFKAELDWYLSQDLCIVGHKGIGDNTTWKRCATADGRVNSNYGYILLNKKDNQYEYALNALLQDRNTRRSVVIYNRPEMHKIHNDGINANLDFTCTMYTQYFIETDNTFTCIVNMRSNDIVYGLPYDYMWSRYVYSKMFNDLIKKYKDLKVGKMYWNVGSLHLYEKHFYITKEL